MGRLLLDVLLLYGTIGRLILVESMGRLVHSTWRGENIGVLVDVGM
jgi:hypothetical protein